MTMTLIETKTLASAAASIEFTSIPQTFTDLVILSSARTNRSSPADGIDLRPNNQTANSSRRFLFGGGASVLGGTGTSIRAGNATAELATVNTFSSFSCYINNYSASTPKSFSVDSVAENNAVDVGLEIQAGLWNDTTAITSLVLLPSLGTSLLSGSTFSLYGITKGSDGIVTTS